MSTVSRVGGSTARRATLGVICLVALFPVYWMVRSAFGSDLLRVPPALVPDSLGLSKLGQIFEDKPVSTWLRNSITVAVTTVIAGLVISVNAAYSLSRYQTRLNRAVGYLILGTQMLPGAVLILPIYIIFLRLDLLNELFGLVIANVLFALPLSVWMLKGFFDAAPIELEEAAMVDGTTRIGAFYRITLRVVTPGLSRSPSSCSCSPGASSSSPVRSWEPVRASGS